MNKEMAVQTIWDYMLLHHELKPVDAIVVLGTHDVRVGQYAAELWCQGLAPRLVCSGSGTRNFANPTWKDFYGSTEAEVFRDIAIKTGVPQDAIWIENQSQNTGQNFEYVTKLFADRHFTPQSVIVVQKPYMERRTYATARVWWPQIELIVTSPPLTLAEYPNSTINQDDWWIHLMVGDLQRIKAYPSHGFQIEQPIPVGVWNAYEYLVGLGYTKCLLKE